MIKIARLPNPTFAVADLDPSDERLSRVPPRDTDQSNRPPALSKSAGPRSTGVEAMKMRAKYLILAIALLCLLALPSTALAEDDSDSGKIDSSVTTVLEATGGNAAVPVIVYTEPGSRGRGRRGRARRRRDDRPGRLRRSRRVPDRGRDRRALRMRRRSISSSPTTRSSGSTTRARSTSPTWRSASTRSRRPPPEAQRAPASASPSWTAASPPPPTSAAAGSSAGRTSSTSRSAPYDDAGHGTFVAGLIAGDGTASLPLDHGGYATMQFRGVAPQPNIVGIKVLDSTGQGRASAVMAGVLWAVAHKHQYNIHVLNLSIGSNPSRRRVRPDRQGGRVRLEERHHGRVRRRQRGRVRPRRHPLPGQQPLRHHRRRDRHAPDGHARATTPSPTTARSARRSGTSTPSRTSWLPATGSSRCASRVPTST